MNSDFELQNLLYNQTLKSKQNSVFYELISIKIINLHVNIQFRV